MKTLRYQNNEDYLISSVSVKFHVRKSNQSCRLRCQKMLIEIEKINKLELRAFNKYLYLKGFRAKQIYKNTLDKRKNCIWFENLKNKIPAKVWNIEMMFYRTNIENY